MEAFVKVPRGPAPWFDAREGREGERCPSTSPVGDDVAERAARWKTFVLLRTVIEQSTSSLRSEALVKLAQLEERVTAAEELGDV